jgi:hypothetical protein
MIGALPPTEQVPDPAPRRHIDPGSLSGEIGAGSLTVTRAEAATELPLGPRLGCRRVRVGGGRISSRDACGRVHSVLVEGFVFEQRGREGIELAAIVPTGTVAGDHGDGPDRSAHAPAADYLAAISVSCWMSDSAPVLVSPSTTSSAARPPSATLIFAWISGSRQVKRSTVSADCAPRLLAARQVAPGRAGRGSRSSVGGRAWSGRCSCAGPARRRRSRGRPWPALQRPDGSVRS